MCEVARHLASGSQAEGCVLRCLRGIEVSMINPCGSFTSGSEALGGSWVHDFGKAQAEVTPVPSHGASALIVERRSLFFSVISSFLLSTQSKGDHEGINERKDGDSLEGCVIV